MVRLLCNEVKNPFNSEQDRLHSTARGTRPRHVIPTRSHHIIQIVTLVTSVNYITLFKFCEPFPTRQHFHLSREAEFDVHASLSTRDTKMTIYLCPGQTRRSTSQRKKVNAK